MIDAARYIETLPTFRDLSAKERETLAIVLTPREVPQATDLFKQGEKATSFFIVAEGRLVQLKEFRAHLVETLGTLEPGDLAGLLSMFNRTEHFHTVKALEDVVVLECTRDTFERLFESQSLFSYKILDKFATGLSRNVRDANRLITDIFSDPKRTLLKLNQALISAGKRLTTI
jgi:CRP-like cAMP-binding protein